MSPRTFPILLLSAVLSSPAGAEQTEGDARQALNQGLEAYQAGNLEEAVEAFGQAADQARNTDLDPAVARFNEANAHLALEGHDTAAEVFTDALRTTDLGLQRDAYFNRGNALMSGAEALEQGAETLPPGGSGGPPAQGSPQSLQPAIDLVEEAAAMYEQAMRLDPDDLDAKVNFELALKKLEELEIKQQQQEQQQDRQQQDDQQQDDQEQQDQQQDQQDGQDQPQDQQQQDPQNGEQDQPAQGDQEQDGQENAPPPEPGDDPSLDDQPGEEEPQPLTTEEMTREEAEMLLDAKREEETANRQRVRLNLGPRQQVEKDW